MVNYVTKKPCTGCGEAFPICYCRDYKNAELFKESIEKRILAGTPNLKKIGER